MRLSHVVGLVCLMGVLGTGCGGPEPEPEPRTVAVTLPSGEQVAFDSSKVCWNTLTPIPEGYRAVPDAKSNSIRFVREAGSVSGLSEPDETPTGITCTCTKGGSGCGPGMLDGHVACLLRAPCTVCERS